MTLSCVHIQIDVSCHDGCLNIVTTLVCPEENPNFESKLGLLSKVVLFQKTLKFKHTIALCYGRQQSLKFQGHVLNPQVWAIAQVVTNTLGPMVQQCVLNQAKVTNYFLMFLFRQFH